MLEYETDDYGGAAAPRRGFAAAALTWAGATIAIALLGGVAWWTYQLGQRDAAEVPVIAALAGPAKMQPDDPGGLQAEHQGLSVNAVVAGTAPPPRPATISLAPPPGDPAEEDQSAAVLEEVLRTPRTPPLPPPETEQAGPLPGSSPGPVGEAEPPVEFGADEAEVDAPDALPPVASVAGPGPMIAPADGAGSPARPTDAVPAPSALPARAPEAAPPETPPVAAAAPEPPPLPPPTARAPARAAIPPRRPGVPAATPEAIPASVEVAVARAGTDAPTAAAAPGPALEPRPERAAGPAAGAPLPRGTMLIQLGAFDSPAVAEAEWSKLQGRHGDILGEKALVIQRTVSSGRVFYRLRAQGFADLAAARATCAALTSRGPACIPARAE